MVLGNFIEFILEVELLLVHFCFSAHFEIIFLVMTYIFKSKIAFVFVLPMDVNELDANLVDVNQHVVELDLTTWYYLRRLLIFLKLKCYSTYGYKFLFFISKVALVSRDQLPIHLVWSNCLRNTGNLLSSSICILEKCYNM